MWVGATAGAGTGAATAGVGRKAAYGKLLSGGEEAERGGGALGKGADLTAEGGGLMSSSSRNTPGQATGRWVIGGREKGGRAAPGQAAEAWHRTDGECSPLCMLRSSITHVGSS